MPYIKKTFDVTTFEQAKNVVLSSDPQNPDKFQNETNFLIDIISNEITIDQNYKILDFGCGIGRVAKEVIQKYSCKIIGIDISESMLFFAKLYTANLEKFKGMTSYNLPSSVDLALCIFSLQHVENPAIELDNIINVLKTNGTLILLNENKRMIPNGIDNEGFIVWEDDGFDVHEYISSRLKQYASYPYLNKEINVVFYKKEY